MLLLFILLLTSSTYIIASSPSSSAFKTPPVSPKRKIEILNLQTPEFKIPKRQEPLRRNPFTVFGAEHLEKIVDYEEESARRATASPRSPVKNCSPFIVEKGSLRRPQSAFPNDSGLETTPTQPSESLLPSGRVSGSSTIPASPIALMQSPEPHEELNALAALSSLLEEMQN